MARSQRSIRPLTLAALLALATPAFAQSEILQTAKDAWGRLQSGQSPKSVPVAAAGAVETWGDPAPARGLEAERRSAERLQQRNPGHRQPSPAPRIEQRADERQLDDRQRDDRLTDPRSHAAASKRTAENDDSSSPRARTAAAPRKRTTMEERYYGGLPEVEDPAPTVRRTSCTNVSRAWEGAAALAERGEEQRAYDAYLRLLSSCSNEKELVGTVYQAQKNLSSSALAELMKEPVMESPKLQAAMYALKLQRMYAANKGRDSRSALSISREIRSMVLESEDVGALEVSGWLEQRARNPKAAEQLFRAALKVNRDADGSRQGLVYALLTQGKLEAAAREVERLEGPQSDLVRADVLLAQARQGLQEQNYADALKKLDQAERLGLDVDDSVVETRAWALKGVGQSEKAAKLFSSLVKAAPQNEDFHVGLVDSLYAARDDKSLERLASESGHLGEVARDAMSRRLDSQGRRVEAARMRGEPVEGEKGYVAGAVSVRSKSGDRGKGRLTETVFPAGDAELRVNDSTKVLVSGMKLDLNDGEHSSRGGEVRVKAVTQVENVEVTVGAGASKTGGTTKATFEAKARLNTESGHVEAGVSREPLRDSVRSYSGVDTTVTDAGGTRSLRVGRVMDTSMYIAGSTILDEINRYKLDWSIGAGSVQGQNTYNNGYYRGTVSVTKDFENPKFSWLNVGPYVGVQSFERDENRFDGAYGGYFSPKSDVSFGLVGRAMTREGGKSLYKATAQMGYVTRGLYYGNDSGIAVETTAEAAWLLSPHLIFGAGVSLRTSPGYNDIGLRVGLKVPFESRAKLSGSDLTTFKVQ